MSSDRDLWIPSNLRAKETLEANSRWLFCPMPLHYWEVVRKGDTFQFILDISRLSASILTKPKTPPTICNFWRDGQAMQRTSSCKCMCALFGEPLPNEVFFDNLNTTMVQGRRGLKLVLVGQPCRKTQGGCRKKIVTCSSFTNPDLKVIIVLFHSKNPYRVDSKKLVTFFMVYYYVFWVEFFWKLVSLGKVLYIKVTK